MTVVLFNGSANTTAAVCLFLLTLHPAAPLPESEHGLTTQELERRGACWFSFSFPSET